MTNEQIIKEYKEKFQITLTPEQAQAIKARTTPKETVRTEWEKGRLITITKIGSFRI